MSTTLVPPRTHLQPSVTNAPIAPLPATAPIAFHRAALDEGDVAAVTAVLRSGWLTTGPRAQEFEKALAAAMGRRHALLLNSATSALFLAYKAAGVGPSDDVLVPAITFMATAEVAIHLGARPVVVDVDPATLLMDVGDLQKKLTRRARVVAPVHYAGHPCAMAPLRELAAAERLAIVEDAAHCFSGREGTRQPGEGTLGAALSFYATKELAVGEGGALVSDDDGVIERARRWSLHGISKPAHARMQIGARAHYDVEDVGYKMNLPDVLAALGLSQLPRMEAQRLRREAIARRYDAALAGLPGVTPLAVRPGFTSARHLYVVRIDATAAGIERDALAAELGAQGIGTSIHFLPIHEMTVLKTLYGTRAADCPVASRAGKEVLSLPIYPGLSDGDIDRIAAAIRALVAARAP